MSERKRISGLVFIAAFGVCSVVAGFAAREPLQRALFEAEMRRATGLDVHVDRLEQRAGRYELEGLSARTRGGAVLLEARAAQVELRDSTLDVELEAPRFALEPERLRGDEWTFGGESSVRVRGGSLSVLRGEVPIPIFNFADIEGTLRATRVRAWCDLRLNMLAAGARYPIVAQTTPAADGGPVQTWYAPALPLAALGALFPSSGRARPTGGWLEDVAASGDPAPRGSAHIDDGALSLGAHQLSGLHGTLIFEANGAGSRRVAGVLDDGVLFEASGEVHDLREQWPAPAPESRDLGALERLTESIAAEPRLRWARVEATAPGLGFGQYGMLTDHGPLAVSVLAVDPAEPTLRFDTAIAEDHVVSGGERTSAMGVRTGAVAGVNGDYFDIGRTYQPQGLLVRSGTLLRGPTDRAVLVIDKAKHVTFGEIRLTGSVLTARGSMPVTEFNDWPPGDVAMITPDYGKQMRPASDAVFVALEPVAGSGKRFRVTAVVPPGGSPPAGFGIAIGPRVHVAPPRVGETVELSYGTVPSLRNAAAAIGGGPILLRDGAWYEDPHAPAPDERDVRWPVVALARQADDRLLLVAVDGRHPERSVGATRPEFADLLQRLGAVDAMALDSGGSVTLVARATGDANVSVRNVVSDFSAERWVSDALFLYSSAPLPTILPPTTAPTPVPETRPTP